LQTASSRALCPAQKGQYAQQHLKDAARHVSIALRLSQSSQTAASTAASGIL